MILDAAREVFAPGPRRRELRADRTELDIRPAGGPSFPFRSKEEIMPRCCAIPRLLGGTVDEAVAKTRGPKRKIRAAAMAFFGTMRRIPAIGSRLLHVPRWHGSRPGSDPPRRGIDKRHWRRDSDRRGRRGSRASRKAPANVEGSHTRPGLLLLLHTGRHWRSARLIPNEEGIRAPQDLQPQQGVTHCLRSSRRSRCPHRQTCPIPADVRRSIRVRSRD